MKLFGIFTATLMIAGMASASSIVVDNFNVAPGGSTEAPVAASCSPNGPIAEAGSDIFGSTATRNRTAIANPGSVLCVQNAVSLGRLTLSVDAGTTGYIESGANNESGATDLEALLSGPTQVLSYDYHTDGGMQIDVFLTLNGVETQVDSFFAVAGSGGFFSPLVREVVVTALDFSNVGGYRVQLSGNIEEIDGSFDNLALSDVPEPSTMALFGAGMLTLGMMRRRRRI